MHRGYVKTYRALEEWALYKDTGAVHLLTHLIINATHKPRKIKFDGKPYMLQPGQLTRGRKQLADETGIKESQIRKLLTDFEVFGEIKRVSTNSCSLITLIKWGQFQVQEKSSPTEQPTEQPTTRQQDTNDSPLNKKEEHGKNEKNITKPKKSTSFKKPTIQEIQQYAQEISFNLDAENFYDHYEANGWTRGKSKIKDWKACVRTWKRNDNSTQIQGSGIHYDA